VLKDLNLSTDEILVTNGARDAIRLVTTWLSLLGGTVFLPVPTYFRAINIFSAHGLEPIEVPTDSSGIIPEALDELLSSGRFASPYLLYIIPDCNNPDGKTLPINRRKAIAEMALEERIWVLEDTVPRDISFSQPLETIFALCHQKNSFLVSSFSKTVNLGLRLGWVVACRERIQDLLRLRGGSSPSKLSSIILSMVVKEVDWPNLKDNLAKKCFARAKLMSGILRNEAMDLFRWEFPSGGLFLWLCLTESCSAEAVAEECERNGLLVSTGRKYLVVEPCKQYIRLAYGSVPECEFQKAIATLADSVRRTLER
jgi:DNA-binding transcriptional MocR family regulator